MIDRTFENLVEGVRKEHGEGVFASSRKCCGLLKDYSRGGYKKEIYIFTAMLEEGFPEELKRAEGDPAHCAGKLVGKLQEEYFVAKDVASDFVGLLRKVMETSSATGQDVNNDMLPANIHPMGAEPSHGIDIAMVFVKGGTFTMGATGNDGDIYTDERPAHQVTLSDFYIGQYVVTQRQWEDVMNANSSYFHGKDLPVETVSWDDVQTFIAELNAKTGKNYRLPTEAEWEYAARGGSQSRGYKYSGSDNIDEVAWCGRNSGRTTHPVGKKKPNELGIYDMSGNVWEWCQDWYGPYSGEAQTNPTGAQNGQYRVIRGGSWPAVAGTARVSGRSYRDPGYRFDSLGFRLACSSR